MTRDDFLGFSPDIKVPLVVSFVNLAREKNLATSFSFDFWDFYVYNESDKPLVAVKTVKNRVTPAILERVLVEKTPLKVILVEGQNPSFPNFDQSKLFLASTGTGLYVRNVGWVILPSTPKVETVQNLQLKMSRRWREKEPGVWVKTCTKCGKEKFPEEFYKSAYKTARDPYRNQCISCFSGKGSE